MKKCIRIALQILLYILSHGILLLVSEFSNKIIGLIIISLSYFFLTYYLWNKTKRNTLLTSILVIFLLEVLIFLGGNGINFSEKYDSYFRNLTHWLLTSIILFTIILMLIKELIIHKEKNES